MARSKGTGSTFKRARDGKWAWQIDAGWTPRGTRRRITKGGYPTKDAAQAALGKKLREIAAEGIPSAGSRSATVKAWSDQWLGHYVKEARPTTYRAATSAVRRHIVPTIGTRRLADLNPGDIRAVHQSALAGGNNSTSTALRTHAVLVTMLKAAQQEGHTVPPAALGVKRPTKAVSDRDAIPLPDALALLHAAAERPNGSRWVAALLQGMRQGECLGLTWDAIDLDNNIIDVSWQLQQLPYADRAAGTFRIPDGYEARRLHLSYHLVRPKTEHGNRIVPIVPWMSAALTSWRRQTTPTNRWGLVWAEPGPRPVRSSTDRAAWRDLQDTAGVRHPSGRRYTLHEARHTTATLLLEEGVDPHIVTAIMGHSTIAVSRGYQHVNQRLTRAALEGVAARLQLAAPVP